MPSWKRTFYCAWVAQIISIAGFSLVLPFMPFYIRDLGVEGEGNVARWGGILQAASSITFVVFSPIWGLLADKYGRKMMVMRSMFGGTIVLALMGFSRNVTDLLICRLLQGALTGTIAASVALVASVAPLNRAGYALGMMQAAVFVGASIGPLLGGVLADSVGYKATFVLASLILLAGGFLIKYGTEERLADQSETGGEASPSYLSILAVGGFMTAVFTMFTINFANSAIGPVFPLFVEKLSESSRNLNTIAASTVHFVENLGAGGPKINTLTGLILSCAGVAAAISAMFFGRFSDAWGHKRLLMTFTFFAGVISFVHVLARNIDHLFALRVLFGIAAAGMMPAANAIIRGLTHEKHIGKAFGITTSLSNIGMVIGPLAGGFLGAKYGLRAPFAMTGVVLGLAAVFVAWRVKDSPKANGNGETLRGCDDGG